MLELEIPAFAHLRIEHAVLDFNGTIAEDGEIPSAVRDKLEQLKKVLKLHVITADTLGTAKQQLGEFCHVEILSTSDHRTEKLRYVQKLGCPSVAAIGNGRNDVSMLKESALGIAVIGKEGGSAEGIASADVVCFGILNALDLLLKPARLLATLRN